MGNNGNERLNNSGCPDPTAYEAMKQIRKEEAIAAKVERDARTAIAIFRNVLDLAGFELIGRIQIKHKKSGRIFK